MSFILSCWALNAFNSFCCLLTVSIARWRWKVSSFSCCCESLRSGFSLQPISAYLHSTFSNWHLDQWSERSQRDNVTLHPILVQGTTSFGHVSRWVVVILQYLPVSLQWGHWCWRFGHLFLRWWSKSRRNSCTISLLFIHLFGQWRRAYPHLLRWLSRDCNSPTQPHLLSQLLHLTLSALISCSPRERDFSGKLYSTLFL